MTRHSFLRSIGVGALLLAPTAVFGQQNGLNLTGFWQDNAGGKFAIRQVGNQIFWLDDSRPKYVNSLFGTISGNTIHAQWADLPGGTMQHSGTLEEAESRPGLGAFRLRDMVKQAAGSSPPHFG